MPHTRITRATAYQKMKDRRAAWLADHGPCEWCGSAERLEVHHRDPTQKEHHAVWSWAETRMLAELAKCAVLCHRCHKDHHARLMRTHGIKQYQLGCRCEKCRRGKAIQMERHRLRKRGLLPPLTSAV